MEEGLEVYDPELNPTAVRWAREEAEQARREQAESRGQGRADEPAPTLVLDAETSRHLRACAATHGITPQRLAALLAARVRTTSEGWVEVAPFTVESAEK